MVTFLCIVQNPEKDLRSLDQRPIVNNRRVDAKPIF
jgi:hypothetical protein